jgi:hypothetical protein
LELGLVGVVDFIFFTVLFFFVLNAFLLMLIFVTPICSNSFKSESGEESTAESYLLFSPVKSDRSSLSSSVLI